MIVRSEPGRESAAAMWSMRSSAMSRSLLPEAPQTTTLPGAMAAPGSVGEKQLFQRIREEELSR